MSKYTFCGVHLRANIHSIECAYAHSTECTYGQISILQNELTDKYTFYRLEFIRKYIFYEMHLWANIHFAECTYKQIHILWNAPKKKYTFYGMRLWANKYSTIYAYRQNVEFKLKPIKGQRSKNITNVQMILVMNKS